MIRRVRKGDLGEDGHMTDDPDKPWTASGRKQASDLAVASDGDLIEAALNWMQHTPFE